MMRLRTLAFLAVFGFCLAAHADTFGTFTLDGTLANGGSITGTIDYDYDNFLGSSITYTEVLDGTSATYNFTSTSDGYYGDAAHTVAFGSYGEADGLKLFFSGTGTFGTLCTVQAPCSLVGTDYVSEQYDGTGGFIDFTSDIATVTSTPEPSTFALFGTGVLGIGGLLRRRPA